MQRCWQPVRGRWVLGLVGAVLAGCASPGPPRAPSLQVPGVVTDLQATRRAGEVELTFTVPVRTADGLLYKGSSVRASVCRAMEAGSCVPVPQLAGMSLPVPAATPGAAAKTTLHDVLPAGLAAGAARLLTYRVELRSDLNKTRDRTAGYGDAAYASAGAAPRAVAGLRAEGSRQGVVVRWAAGAGEGLSAGADGEVVLRRERVSGQAREDSGKARKGVGGRKPEEPRVVWLSTSAAADPLGGAGPEDGREPISKGGSGQAAKSAGGTSKSALPAHGVVDDDAEVNGTYRYAAERQRTVQLGGHAVVLHSGLSTPVEIALRAVYPPPAPTDLVGTVFPVAKDGAEAGLAVDLIWTPADDAGTVGYNVFREVLDASGAPGGERVRLTPQPVRMPAFHDALPAPLAATGRRLRYSVEAVDGGGLQSVAASTVVAVWEP